MLIFEEIPNYKELNPEELINYLLDNNETEFKTIYGSLIYDISDIDDELMEFLHKITK